MITTPVPSLKAALADGGPPLTRANRRPLAAAANAAVALIALTAAMFALAAPASAKLVWIPRAGYRLAAYVQPAMAPRSCSATASPTTTTCTTASCHC